LPIINGTVVDELNKFLTSHHILKGSRIGVAFSGGSDSVALLLALSALISPDRLEVMYVNHRLRSDSELDAEIALNRETCKTLGLALKVLDLGIGKVKEAVQIRQKGLEEAARTLRYEALIASCKASGCSYLATAHNADDQMETLLMRMFHAASISSLKGIETFRNQGEVKLIRPLLGVSHAELRSYVQASGFDWSEDTSNAEDAYLRNQIRHTINPAILEVFPNAYSAISIMSKRFGDIAKLLEQMEEDALKSVLYKAEGVEFPLVWYQNLPAPLKELILFRLNAFVESSNDERYSSKLIQRLQYQLDASSSGDSFTIESGGTQMYLHNGKVEWTIATVITNYCFSLENPMQVSDIELPGNILFSIRKEDPKIDDTLLRIDANLLCHPILRSMQIGDQIVLAGGTISVSKLLSSYKIPKKLQSFVPVLCDRSGIVAVFARAFGGKDRLALRFKTLLAPSFTNIYSSIKRKDNSEIQK